MSIVKTRKIVVSPSDCPFETFEIEVSDVQEGSVVAYPSAITEEEFLLNQRIEKEFEAREILKEMQNV